MLQILVDFLTSPAVLAVLGVFAVAVLDALASAFTNSHPLIARALMALADMIRNKTGTRPPLAMLLVLALVLLPAAASAAEPVGAVVIALDDGKAYVMCADGVFRPKVKAGEKLDCVCGDSCKCAAGQCPSKCPVSGERVKCPCLYCSCVPHQPGMPWVQNQWETGYNCGSYACQANGGGRSAAPVQADSGRSVTIPYITGPVPPGVPTTGVYPPGNYVTMSTFGGSFILDRNNNVVWGQLPNQRTAAGGCAGGSCGFPQFTPQPYYQFPQSCPNGRCNLNGR